jgi:2,5-diamino-6-(ribosylamino)-4(3H)-pyrimidinone 5'-phosphate reductase
MAKPTVIVHSAVSLDGRIDGFEPDVSVYYELVATWGEDVTLCGSGTILAAASEPDPPKTPPLPPPDPGDDRPLLAVIDTRGRVRSWNRLISAGHWRAGLALCSRATPEDHLAYLRQAGVDSLVAGADRVDVAAALEILADRGARTVRVDAGPTLNGVVLGNGLVDELSLLVHPVIAAEGRPFAERLESRLDLKPLACEERGALLWLRFACARPPD